ncbi:ferritin-like domain-containing protein [Frankia sp. Ag45/Mut15]|uniref:Ferritin-like domain-containing protein n=1 Tax=Frankia umida TaxID=573489 RepID=A0ABT0K5D2_9ACTN|nr:ferritin-like domain-containing protein [Frankia umida]MCK9878916.1 ferritin-like domain-containing protein [Frankia umida]
MSSRRLDVGDAELRAMTADLDQAHRDTFPAAAAQLTDLGRDLGRGLGARAANRRGVLLGGLTAVGAGVLAACGSSSSGGGSNTGGMGSSAAATTGGRYTGDLKVVALAAALENLAVAAYSAVLTKAGAGTYGTVPPAIGEFVTVVRSQHTDHGKAWNGVLASAKLPEITGAPLTIAAGEVAKLNQAKTLPEVARIALDLETGAAQTYLSALTNVTNTTGISTAATIAPVEAMHAAVLRYILGDYPVPDSFLGTTAAIAPTVLTAA